MAGHCCVDCQTDLVKVFLPDKMNEETRKCEQKSQDEKGLLVDFDGM